MLNENAGTPRQLRKLNYLSKTYSKVTILTLNKARWLCFESILEFEDFKNNSKFVKKKYSYSIFGTGILRAILRFFKNDLLFQFLSPSYILFLLHLIRAKRKNPKIDVFISSPPFPVFLDLIFNNNKLFMDMRDPWSLHDTLAKITFHRKMIESRFLKKCSEITVVSKFMQTQLREEFKVESHVKYNFPEEKTSELHPIEHHEIQNLNKDFQEAIENGKIISYIGTTPDNFYDLSKISLLLENFVSNNEGYFLFFIGDDSIKKRFSKDFISSKKIHFINRVTRRSSICYMQLSDYVLFFGHRFDGYLSTKLFEYFYLKKRILAMDMNEDHEIYEILKKYDGTRFITDLKDFVL